MLDINLSPNVRPAESTEKASNPKGRLRAFFSDKYNLVFIFILIFAFAVRLYFFFLTKNQTVWWDEAEYLDMAKHWALGTPFAIGSNRMPLFPFLIYIFMKLGASEILTKFFVSVAPSLFAVFVTYVIAKEFFDKKTALISSFIMAVFWELLFWTNRFQPDMLAIVFNASAIYFFYKGLKNQNFKYAVLVALFFALSFLTRTSGLLVPMIIFPAALIFDNASLFKKKKLAYYGAMVLFSLLFLGPYFFWSNTQFGTPFGFMGAVAPPSVTQRPPAFDVLNVFNTYLNPLLFVFFIIGLLSILQFVLIIDKIKLSNLSEDTKRSILFLLWLLIPLLFFIFYVRALEPRWLYIIAPATFILAARGLETVRAFLSRFNRVLAIIVIISILLVGAYMQINEANNIITVKKDTYAQVKDAALWMKEHSTGTDVLASISQPQTLYYSDRETVMYSETNETSIVAFLETYKPKYLTISIFEPHPEYIYNYVREHNSTFVPVQAYSYDKNNVALVVYEVKWPN